MPDSVAVQMLLFICDKSTRNKVSTVLIDNQGMFYYTLMFILWKSHSMHKIESKLYEGEVRTGALFCFSTPTIY